MKVLSVLMKEPQCRRLEIANSYDISPDGYVYLSEIMPQFDENGSGSYSNSEIKAAINAMCEDPSTQLQAAMSGDYSKGGYNLDQSQKAVLWQLLSNSTSAKNNPYSSDVGWQVIDAKKTTSSEKDEDELPGTFGEEILRQWGNQ